MENRSVKFTQPDQVDQWVDNAGVALSASLALGRDKASQIAQPLLLALFTLTANDFKKALEIVANINDFSIKRIFLEQFKYCYIVNTGAEDLFALVSTVDFSSQQTSNEYDSVLLKLYNEHDKDVTLLRESLGALPVKAKRVALERLRSEEFHNFKKIKIRPKLALGRGTQPLINTWRWILICVSAVAITIAQMS